MQHLADGRIVAYNADAEAVELEMLEHGRRAQTAEGARMPWHARRFGAFLGPIDFRWSGF